MKNLSIIKLIKLDLNLNTLPSRFGLIFGILSFHILTFIRFEQSTRGNLFNTEPANLLNPKFNSSRGEGL